MPYAYKITATELGTLRYFVESRASRDRDIAVRERNSGFPEIAQVFEQFAQEADAMAQQMKEWSWDNQRLVYVEKEATVEQGH